MNNCQMLEQFEITGRPVAYNNTGATDLVHGMALYSHTKSFSHAVLGH